MIDFLKYFFNPSTIALLLGGILTSLFGFLASISKEEKTPKWIARGAFIAGIIVLFGGVMSGYQQERNSKLLQSRTEQIENLSQKNIELSSELSKINKEIAATVTGGESFCYLFPSPSFGKLNTMDFNLWHMGKYPVYDSFIRVWDDTCLAKIDHAKIFENHYGYRNKEITYEEWLKMKDDPTYISKNKEVQNDIKEQMKRCLIVQKSLGTITPKKSQNIMDIPLITVQFPFRIGLAKYSQEYSVSIVARNGEYNQKISIGIRNKRYYIYSKVEKLSVSSAPVVVREYESIDSDMFAIKNIK
jgi:hypothetical protein